MCSSVQRVLDFGQFIEGTELHDWSGLALLSILQFDILTIVRYQYNEQKVDA